MRLKAAGLDRTDNFRLVSSTPRRRVALDHPSTEPARTVGDARRASRHDRAAVVAALAASLAVALAVGWALRPPVTPNAWLNRLAPNFTLPTDLGPPVTLSEMEGSVVVIHFIILVCCSYSALEVGYMMEVETMLQNRGVFFLSIVMDSKYNFYSPKDYRELMGFDWPLALDAEGDIQRLYDADETSTFIIDRDGFVQYRDDDTTAPSTLFERIAEVS